MKQEKEIIQIRLATDNDFETIFLIWLEGISNSFDFEDANKNSINQNLQGILIKGKEYLTFG